MESKKKVLAIHEPLISTYTSYGAIFSIIPRSAMPWVLNNFIQINFVEAWGMATFDFHKLLLNNCPSIDLYTEREVSNPECQTEGLKNKIIEGIDSNYYLFFYVDRYDIECAEEYQKMHCFHEIFVYGYDLEQNQVYICDNFQDGKFIQTSCSFQSISRSYGKILSQESFMKKILYLKVCENTFCKLNIKKIEYNLRAYIRGEETYSIIGEPTKIEYGVSVIDLYVDYISKIDGQWIDQRFFHLLYEHKTLMEMRVRSLLQLGYVDEKDIDIEEFVEQIQRALILRNLVIKYNLLRDEDLTCKICNKLLELRRWDVMLISLLLWSIENKEGDKKDERI